MSKEFIPLTAREKYWHEYFASLHGRTDLDEARRVGMSNNRVISQEYSLLLEASGAFAGSSCLDVGCGLGQLARGMQAMGGEATGIDYILPTIELLQRTHPGIAWWHEDISAPSERLLTSSFDIICLCEVLQHVDAAVVLPLLWRLLRPGGRIVGLVPNAACPIVRRVEANYAGSYRGLTPQALRKITDQLTQPARLFIRGLTFQPDQSIVPYAVSAWGETAAPVWTQEPNRLQFTLLKSPPTAALPGP